MTNMYYVPIEPLEERYTAQWYKYFPKHFNKKFNTIIIDGEPLTDKVEVGTFLDINSTIAYKNSQMIKIAKLFRNNKIPCGSIFFFGDLEFWGIESLRLMADMNNIKIKIYGFLHAASYVQGDAFQIAEDYQKFTEIGWVLSMDKVFVATQYHKELFLEKRGSLAGNSYHALEEKIIPVGNPLFLDAYKEYNLPKENNILLTNRPDKEKMVDVTLKIFKDLKKDYPSWNFIATTGRSTYKSNDTKIAKLARKLEQNKVIQIKENLSKEQYHQELQKAKVVVTNNEIEETFGYCPMEAAMYNATPICPDLLSHPELCKNDSSLLYKPGDYEDCKRKIIQAMQNPKDYKHLTNKYESAKVIDKMIKIMEK